MIWFVSVRVEEKIVLQTILSLAALNWVAGLL